MFTFQTLWTPRVILVIYLLGLVVIVLSGLAYAYFAMQMGAQSGSSAGGGIALVSAVIGTLISIVLWRVWCEIVLVLFKVHDRLVEVRDAVGK
jgi:hypothetical protein